VVRVCLKTEFNEFPLFKTKLIKGYSYASVILENIKKKYLCSFNWRFWCRKILRSKLPRTNLAMPEVSCDVTWYTHGSPRYSAFWVRCWKIPPPDSWLSWARSLVLDCDAIGIGGSERNSRTASVAQLSVEGGACILSVTTAESHEYTEVSFDVTWHVTSTKYN